MDWQIFGHKSQIEFLGQAIASDKVAHAYIFAGPSMVGKKTVARKFAEMLLGSSFKNNPDYIEIEGGEGIKIEAIRDLAYKLSLKPYLANYKVAVLDDAESLTVEAANALLKALEEPKPRTVIILITSNPVRLLRTISSRAQKITFGLVNKEEYAKMLEQKHDKRQSALIDKLSLGRPGMAWNILNANNDELERWEQILSFYQILIDADLVEKMKVVYELADLKAVQIKEILDIWINLANHGHADSLIIARKMVDQNANSKLLLSNLALKFT